MRSNLPHGMTWLFFAAFMLIAVPALAFIQKLFTIRELVGEASVIFVAKVDRLDTEKPAVALSVVEALKGKPPTDRLLINLAGDQLKHAPQLLQRLAVDLPLVVYCTAKEGQPAMLLAYTNGTWFQVLGHADGEQTRWAFTHCEIYLRRTFSGSTDALKQTTADVIAGKTKGPLANPKERPGLGPEIQPPAPAKQ